MTHLSPSPSMCAKVVWPLFLSLVWFMTSPALAIDDRPTPYAWRKHPVEVKIPVSWEISRSDFLHENTASQTESFHETWTLRFSTGIEVYLESPRGRIKVNATNRDRFGFPTFVVMTEMEFAQLIGVPATATGDGEAEGEVVEPKLVSLRIVPQAQQEDVTLFVSLDDFVTVHIEMGL